MITIECPSCAGENDLCDPGDPMGDGEVKTLVCTHCDTEFKVLAQVEMTYDAYIEMTPE